MHLSFLLRTMIAFDYSCSSQRALARFDRHEASLSSAQGVFDEAKLRQKRIGIGFHSLLCLGKQRGGTLL
jgi:hypothetical protein